jgi:glutamyl-tRNA reductase
MNSPSALSDYMQILNARVTFRNAPVHLLERFAFKDLEYAYNLLIENAVLDECVIIQTCNRVEIYASSRNTDERKLINAWAYAAGLPSEDLSKTIEVMRGKDVVLHLLNLASGLDSLVLGEDQILGQVKRAYDLSRKKQYAGNNLSIIFDKAIKVGSRVRNSTGVNKGSISIGSMAVNLAEDYLDNLKDRNILLIGSGEGASLVAKSLKQRDVSFSVTSRTFERARSFADTVAGDPVSFEDALAMLSEIDLVFVCTTAPYFLVTYDRITKAMRYREKGMIIFDLSNPRTVEENVATIKKIKLVNLDQISEIVERNIHSRRTEIISARRIIEFEMKTVDALLKRKRAEPIVVSVFKSVDTIREREVRKALSMLREKIDPTEIRIIEQLSHAIVEGIMSVPMNNIRKELEGSSGDEDYLRGIIAKLFNYENN